MNEHRTIQKYSGNLEIQKISRQQSMPRVLSKRSFFVITVLLALFTIGIHEWNRLVFHVPSLPTPEDLVFAKWTFWGTLAAGYAIPLLLINLVKQEEQRIQGWPVLEGSILIAGIFVGALFISQDLSIPQQDIVGPLLAYVAAFVSWPLGVARSISNIREKNWRFFAASMTVTLIAIVVVFIVSGAIVYFE